MKPQPKSNLTLVINVVGLAGVMLILVGLIWVMYHFTQPEAVDQSRWAERKRNLSEVNAQTKDQLENYGWLDRDRGVVRIPISRAIQLTIAEYQDQASGRANRLALLEKAAPPATAPAANTNTPAAPAPK